MFVEKKSINLPIVKGTVIETADEARRRPMAASKGFVSGFARATIFRKEEVF